MDNPWNLTYDGKFSELNHLVLSLFATKIKLSTKIVITLFIEDKPHSLTYAPTDHKILKITERIAMNLGTVQKFYYGPRRSLSNGFDKLNRALDPDPLKTYFCEVL